MKTFLTLLFLLSTTFFPLQSTPLMQEINAEAKKVVRKSLVEFYTNYIDVLDAATLKTNPELVLRRIIAMLYSDDDEEEELSADELREAISFIEKECQFVMDNSEPPSRLFLVAKFYQQVIQAIMPILGLTEKESTLAFQAFETKCLRQWAPTSSATGKELREEILFNFQREGVPQSFIDFAINTALMSDSLTLDYALDPYEVLELSNFHVSVDEDGDSSISCQIKMRNKDTNEEHLFPLEI
jgi:hypothetical protein